MADDDVADLLDEALESAKNEAPAEPKPNEPKDSNKEKDKEEKDRSRSKKRSRSRSRDRRSGSRDRFGRVKRPRDRSRERGSRSRDRRDKDRRRSRSRRRRSRNRGGRRRRTSSSRAKRRGRDRDRDREREKEKERGGKKEGSSSPRRPQRSAISPESMPKLADPPVSSPKDPPPPGSAPEEGDDKKKKKSKWDEMGDPSALPDWLKDLKEDGRPTPPGIDPARFKIIRMEGVQIRALIGKGGETIKDIRLRSGADIKIDHLPSDPEGNVTIVGDVEKTEVMIKEALATKGCPLVPKPQVPPPPPDGMLGMSGAGGMHPPLEPNENEVIVPGDIVGHLIGPSGATMKEIREQAGGQVFISILPPSTPGADQIVRVVGDNREYARQLILEKIEDLKVQYRPPGGLPVPGFPGSMGMPGIGAPMGGAAPVHVPGKSKATFPQPPMPMLQPSALPVPSMPLRPAPAALPYGGAGSTFVPRPGVMTQAGCGCGCGGCGCGGCAGCGGCGCYAGGPEMDPRPSLGGCGLAAMGSTTGPSPGYMGGCGVGGLGMAQMPPPSMGPPAGMGIGMGMAPGPPGGGLIAPPPPAPPGRPGPPGPPAPGLGGGSCHLKVGPPVAAPQANFPPPAPPMAPPVTTPAVSAPPAMGLGSIGPPIPAEPPGQDSEKQDFNAMLREAAKAAEATIGMSNTPKPSTPSAGVPLL